MSEPLSKQQKQWNKQLTQHIERYSYLRDWSELAAWLSRLKNLFADRKGPVLDKQILLKRLATSLNAALPVALHEAALEIYQMLFSQAIIAGEQLSTACIGLFSFFGQANVKNKTRMLEILGKHLPVFGRDLQLLAIGLVITILPSINEMHEGLVKEVTAFLQLLARPQLIGVGMLSEALWVAVLRSPGCRVAGLKYLSSKLGRGVQEEENDEEDTFWNEISSMSKKKEKLGSSQDFSEGEKEKDQKDLLSEYCPSIETLVVNALTLCIEDSNVLAIKAALDFLYKYLPLKTDTLSNAAKTRLARSVVWLLGKRDTSVTRKINLWLFGKPDDQNQYCVNQQQLGLITDVLIEFLQKETSMEPLKIAINLLTEHEALPQLILGQLVPHLLQFCMRQEGSAQNAKEVTKHMHRLIDRVRPHLPLFSLALSKSLTASLTRGDFPAAQQSIRLSDFFVSRIVKQEDLHGAVRSFLKLLLEGSVLARWQDREFMKVSLGRTIEVLERHKDLLRETRTGEGELQLLLEHNKLFSDLLDRVAASREQEVFEEEISLMNRLLAKIEDVFGVAGDDWLVNTVRNISLTNPQHFLSAIQALGDVMERDSPLGKEVVERAGVEGRGNFIKVSLGKLWGIFSLGHLQSRVVPLLLRLVKNFPVYFEELLGSQFDSSSELAIIKFRHFWDVAPKNTQIMSSQMVEEVSKNGLFRMLEFLDNSNPLVKYHSHLWITETYPSFHRVLNPILQILLRPRDCWYRTPQGQYVFAVAPDIPLLLRTLRHLRSFVRLVPQQFNKFAFKPLTPKIHTAYLIFRGNEPTDDPPEVPYAAPLLELVVRLTESKLVGGDNRGVDLGACQLLETVVRTMSAVELGSMLVRDHFRSLLRSLHFATLNEEHLLQIQLLDLLRLLLTDSSVRRAIDPKVLRDAVGGAELVNTVLQGVGCSFPYIKQRFVQFLNECVPMLVECSSGAAQAVSRVLNTYTNKIAYVNSKKVEASSLKDLQIQQKNAEILILFQGIKDLLSNFLNLHLRPFEKERNQHDTDSGLFCFYSWKSYIALKIDRRPEPKHRKLHEDISKQLINELPSLLAIMAACWTLSELRPHYGLVKEGLSVFNYEDFLEYNRALGAAQNRLETEDSVEAFIVSLLRVLLNAYPGETMRAIVSCWTAASKDVETRLKILELLVFSGLPVEGFYSMLGDALSPSIGRKRKGATMQAERVGQQDVLQLCQAFSHFNFQNPSYFQTHNLTNIWLSFTRFLRLFDNTRNALTLFALLELLDLVLEKYNPKQIVREERLRKDLQALVTIHNDLHFLIGGKLKMETTSPLRLTSMYPLPTSVFHLRASVLQASQEGSGSWVQWEECSGQRASELIRLMAITVARRVSFTFISCLQNDSEIGLVRRVREVILGALPLVEVKAQGGALVEGASELVLGLLEGRGPLFAKQVKSEILQIFNKEDFFICSSRTLQAWARIIDLLIDSNRDHDIFQEYLEKVSLVSSLFSSYTAETKKKIKSFERICFILYSGRKDKYTDRAQLLIDKISEVIKHSEAPQPVLILVFFCVRVLILRTSQEKLTKLLAALWQMVLFLLATVFAEPAHRDRLNLHWAALKLVEMISLMQIPEFHPHQWSFFYDFVGVRFSTQVAQPGEEEVKLGVHPRIRKFLPGQTRLVREGVGAVEEKRHLIIKEDKIDDIQLLKTKALLLSSYLVASSGCRMQFDMREVEELIQNDFLNLDQFIFKVK